MIQDIHKKVLKRLAYGWLSLSILIGGVVFYIEMEKVDSLVLRRGGISPREFDGSGYLRGLKGEQIPLLARIFAVVDVFDALSSRRPYKEAFDLAGVMRIMRSSLLRIHAPATFAGPFATLFPVQQKSGTHFDPHLLNIFNGIAEPLYAEIGHAGEERLTDLLNRLIRRYFSGPSP